MRARHMWSAVAAAGLIAGFGVVCAAPSSAASQTISVDCTLPTLGRGIVPQTLTVAQGDSLTFVPTVGECTSAEWPFFVFLTDGTTQTGPGPYVFTIRPDAPLGAFGGGDAPTSVIRILDRTQFLPRGQTYNLIVVSGTEATAASPIPAWVQAYGRASADAKCVDGWNPSWDLWPNGGKGGFVCQREIPSLG